MQPSGADRGFFQAAPTLQNQFHDDASYRRCYKLFLPKELAAECEPEVAKLGDEVLSDRVFAWVTDAERNKPYLKGSGRDSFGRWVGEIVTSEGWRELQRFGISKGIVAAGYDDTLGVFARPLQFLRMHLWEASSANATCPSAMQDGAAALMKRHLASNTILGQERRTFQDAFSRLTSRDPDFAWTSGQWMTERSGGSDVSRTETLAEFRDHPEDKHQGPALASLQGNIPLGPWSISGFKWFSSATDSNMTVLLARTEKGLTTFFAPMRKHDPEAMTITGRPQVNGSKLNGVWIQRLKNKLGTKSLPTAELVLNNMRAWKIGQEGKGISEITTVITLTRVHNLIAAVGYVGRGLGIARAYARRREVGGSINAGGAGAVKLDQNSLHMRTMAKMTAEYHGLMLLSFFSCYVLGLSEHKSVDREALPPSLEALTPPDQHVLPLLRVIVQLAKAYVCKNAVPLLYSCMEALGGVGYLVNDELEYLNVARLYRDCCALPIWEGTTDVLSTDFIRAIKRPATGKDSLDALECFVRQGYRHGKRVMQKPAGWDPVGKWYALRRYVEGKKLDDLVGESREIVWDVADLLISVLLFVDAGADGDKGAEEMFLRFCEERMGMGSKRERGTAAEELGRDLTIVYGSDGVRTVTEVVQDVMYNDVIKSKL
ncbi:putative acyl-CoA dehydrogenase AidB [Escovopsis weberi]|uniref:Putative acyl-CoA dehydrogenase AidB n=1 Tax=Escovopsis weberi TaxID=150374 RepID=A0A0M9VUV8_ESCWE|nr:putative acyl-CoA dehydrogenase AidB [Escovopsis weberi]